MRLLIGIAGLAGALFLAAVLLGEHQVRTSADRLAETPLPHGDQESR